MKNFNVPFNVSFNVPLKVSFMGLMAVLSLSACSGDDSDTDAVADESPQDTNDAVTFAPAAINQANAADIVSSINVAGQKSLENYAVSLYLDLNSDDNMQACESGSLMIEEQLSSDDVILSAGDNITVTYTSCVNAGLTIDGQFMIVIENFSGDLVNLSSVELSARVVFSELTTQREDSVERINGDITTAIFFDDSFGFNFESTSTMLSIQTNDQSVTLENFSARYASNVLSGTNSYAIFGTVHSSELEGSVSFDTIEDFSSTRGGVPDAGTIIATGSDNSSITLDVLGVNDVIVDIDSNGDGITDISTQGDWRTLDVDLGILNF